MPKAVLRNLLQRSTAALYLERDGRIIGASGDAGPLIPNGMSKLEGTYLGDLIIPEQQEELTYLLDRCLTIGSKEGALFTLKDGLKQRQLLFMPRANSKEDVPENAAIIVQDVTNGLNSTDINDLTHELFNSILHDLSEGIIIVDRQKRILHINEHARAMLMLDEENVSDFTTELDRLQDVIPDDLEIEQLYVSGREIHKVVQVQDPHREAHANILLNIYPVKDAEGRVIQVIETLQDISQENQTADKIRQVYSRLQEKVRVLGVLNKLSNDFNICSDGKQLYPRITRTLVWGLGLNDTIAVLSLRPRPDAPLELKSYFGIDEDEASSLMEKPEGIPDNTVLNRDGGGLDGRFEKVGIGSAIFAPIILDGQTMGYLNLFHRSGDPNLDPEETLVRILTENLKHFIKRRRAEQSLRTKVLTFIVLRQIGDAFQIGRSLDHIAFSFLTGVTAEQGLGFNRAFLFLIDDESEQLVGHMAVGPSSPEEAAEIWGRLRTEGTEFSDMMVDFDNISVLRDTLLNSRLTGRKMPLVEESFVISLFEQRQPRLMKIDDLHNEKVRSILQDLGCIEFAAAPLFGTDRPLGIVIADNMINREPISDDDLRFMELACKAGQSAIENIQLNEELQKKVEILKRSNVLLQEHRNQLANLERLSTIGEMAASVAHEIRNPLVIIGGFARSLLDDITPDDPKHRDLKIIKKEVARLENVVTELLDFAKPIKPKFRSVVARDLIMEVLAITEPDFSDSEIQMMTRLDRVGAKIWGDPDLIKHVLLNLLQNAKNAMPEGGRITLFSRAAKDMMQIGVKDTGTGISDEKLEKIFEPFFTTRKSGTGLGLAIVQKIVRSHGGHIKVKSTEGKGTTFTVCLPYGEYSGR